MFYFFFVYHSGNKSYFQKINCILAFCDILIRLKKDMPHVEHLTIVCLISFSIFTRQFPMMPKSQLRQETTTSTVTRYEAWGNIWMVFKGDSLLFNSCSWVTQCQSFLDDFRGETGCVSEFTKYKRNIKGDFLIFNSCCWVT